jgi:hypothetical protein
MPEMPKREDSAAFAASLAHGGKRQPGGWSGSLLGSGRESFRLSREERDHIAGHALDSINDLSRKLTAASEPCERETARIQAGSGVARKIAALSNLLGDIGWEREGTGPREGSVAGMHPPAWILGELFPVAQLRPWLEEWQRQDDEALKLAEGVLEVAKVAVNSCEAEPTARIAVSDAQTRLGTGAILLARIEKWMASHEN